MAGKEMIRRDLTILDLEAADCKQVMEHMAGIFLEKGYVKDSYLGALMEREEKYPTAIPLPVESVAIPHTMPEHIVREFIAPIRLAHPVEWGEMSDPSTTTPVRMIFMLGLLGKEHIELLQVLVHNFQRQEWLDKLAAAKTEDEFYDAVMELEWKVI